MLNLGTGEVLVILLVALLVLGPEKLPEAARKVGQFLGDLRRMSAGFQAELRDAMQEPVHGTPVERSDGMPPRADAASQPGAASHDAAANGQVEAATARPGHGEADGGGGRADLATGDDGGADDDRSGDGHTAT